MKSAPCPLHKYLSLFNEATDLRIKKRSLLSDFASLMHNLEQAFKKYNVHEVECQMYVACEAAQLDRQDENGPLAKIVYDIIK